MIRLLQGEWQDSPNTPTLAGSTPCPNQFACPHEAADVNCQQILTMEHAWAKINSNVRWNNVKPVQTVTSHCTPQSVSHLHLGVGGKLMEPLSLTALYCTYWAPYYQRVDQGPRGCRLQQHKAWVGPKLLVLLAWGPVSSWGAHIALTVNCMLDGRSLDSLTLYQP